MCRFIYLFFDYQLACTMPVQHLHGSRLNACTGCIDPVGRAGGVAGGSGRGWVVEDRLGASDRFSKLSWAASQRVGFMDCAAAG